MPCKNCERLEHRLEVMRVDLEEMRRIANEWVGVPVLQQQAEMEYAQHVRDCQRLRERYASFVSFLESDGTFHSFVANTELQLQDARQSVLAAEEESRSTARQILGRVGESIEDLRNEFIGWGQ